MDKLYRELYLIITRLIQSYEALQDKLSRKHFKIKDYMSDDKGNPSMTIEYKGETYSLVLVKHTDSPYYPIHRDNVIKLAKTQQYDNEVEDEIEQRRRMA